MGRLRLCLLGPFQATSDGKPVTGFESNKVRALLAYLALEADRPHPREALVGLLWPDQPEAGARDNLRQALANLRRAIGDHSASPSFLLITRESVQFNAASDHWLDAAAFSNLLAACARHRHRRPETCPACAQRWEQAADLYRGNLLENSSLSDSAEFDEWALAYRERLRRDALETFFRLAAYAERRGAFDQAQRWAARQLELDPWREEAHQQAMRAQALGGQRSAALAQYETCRRTLADALRVEPSAETQALYELIRSVDNPAQLMEGLVGARPASHLPAPPTAFVGREKELAEIGDLLQDPACRLLTLIGPGGIGKTRLALQVAADHGASFMHGAHFVSLASLSSPDFLDITLAGALGIAVTNSAHPRDSVFDYLRDKEILLVLDSVEHLAPGLTVLGDLLEDAPHLSLLVTSRERLTLQSEWIFEVSGLTYPPSDEAAPAQAYSAIELFVQRARQVNRLFALTSLDQLSVTHICQGVEGMPLAIELAAAAVRERTCAEIAAEVKTNLRSLARAWPDAPARHRSMWAAFDHSWNRLSPEEQRDFRQLSVFRGGFTAEAAEQVAGATAPLLSALVDKSLLQREAEERYDLHELLRQYADEKLREAGEAEQALGRHLEFFLNLVHQVHDRLEDAVQQSWLARLDSDNDNLRAALGWAIESQQSEAGWQLVGWLWKFWEIRGYLAEGRHWSEVLLAGTSQRTAARAKALNTAATLAVDQGDYESARGMYEESLAIRRELGDRPGTAAVLNNLGNVALNRANYAAARALYEESLAIRRELGDKPKSAAPLFNLGITAQRQGDHAAARQRFEESLALYRELGNEQGVADAFGSLGALALDQGDQATAEGLFERAKAVFQRLGDKRGTAFTLQNLGNAALGRDDLPHAAVRYAEAIRLRVELGDRRAIAETLEGSASVAGSQWQSVRAAKLFGAAEALREAIGAPIPDAEAAEYSSRVSAVRSQLDEKAFAQAWAEGRALTIEQAVALALRDSADPATPAST